MTTFSYTNVFRNQHEQVVPDAQVYVYTSQGDLAELTQDGGGALSNPVTTDEYGAFTFNAEHGVYTLAFHYGGREVLREAYVLVGDGPELPADLVAALVPSLDAAAMSATSAANSAEAVEEDRADVAEMKAQVTVTADAAILAALTTPGFYDSLADGEAGTSDGDPFVVMDPDETGIQFYRNETGDGVLKKTVPDTGAPPFTSGAPGGFLLNNSASSSTSSPTWTAPEDVNKQKVVPVDILTASQVQLAKTSTTGTFTATETDGKLRIQPTALGSTNGFRVAGTPVRVEVGTVARLRVTVPAPPVGTQWGLALAVLQDAPTPGGAMFSLPADTPIISLRGDNGGLTVLDPDGGAYPDAVPDVGGGGSGASGLTLDLIYDVRSATSARITTQIDEANEFARTWSGFPATGYIAPGAWLINLSDAADVDVPSVYYPAPAMPLYLHLLQDAPNGTGTDRLPFGTIGEAADDWRYDSARRTLDITLKGGTVSQSIFDEMLAVDLPGLRELTIRSTVGTRTKIDASVAVTPTFTNIAGSEVWYTDTPLFLDANATYGAFICVSEGVYQDTGYNDFYRIEGVRVASRLTFNVAYDDASFVRGRQSVHISGTYAGKTLLRMWDGGDPNAEDWRWSRRQACIYLPASDQDGWNSRRVNIENIDLFGGFVYGMYADRWTLDMTSVAARTTVNGPAFELNHCGGVVRDLFAEGFGLDSFHTADIGTKPLEGADPVLWFYDCISRGGYALYAPDGWSNHGRALWKLRNCESTAPGKSCIATAGGIDAEGMLLQGAPEAGLTFANTSDNIAANGANRTASLRRATVKGNLDGILLSIYSGSDASVIMDIDDILFDTNGQSSAHLNNDGTDCTVELRYDPNRLRFTGATPSHGSDFWNDGGTLTELVTRAKV